MFQTQYRKKGKKSEKKKWGCRKQREMKRVSDQKGKERNFEDLRTYPDAKRMKMKRREREGLKERKKYALVVNSHSHEYLSIVCC
jgi:hypothetical protein